MLNKELLVATTGQPVGPIKLTVSQIDDTTVGYLGFPFPEFGAINKIPTWSVDGITHALLGLTSNWEDGTMSLAFDTSATFSREIHMSVIEKDIGIALRDSSTYYYADGALFDDDDVDKTFTIVFDPEPTGYVTP